MQIEVKIDVDVELHEEAFTPEFLKSYSGMMYPLDSIKEHAENIAQLLARGVMEPVEGRIGTDQFIEGYGEIGRFVKKARIGTLVTELTET